MVSPKQLGDLARQGKIDAGPISLLDSLELEEQYEALGNFGIAVKNSAKSVLLFSKKSIDKLAGCAIGLTPQTVTSSLLLKFILEGKYGIEPKYQQGFARNCDAQLRIGDDALQAVFDKKITGNFSYVYDLGEEWHKWQNLPFVFARWMVKKNLGGELKKMLSETLENNIKSAEKNTGSAIAWFEKKYNRSFPQPKEYLRGFSYRIGETEKKAIAVFKRLTKGFAATACGC